MRDIQRIIQESVPGKQITLAHIIANPDGALCRSLGIDAAKPTRSAIGVMTITPAETAIIIADIAIKTSGADIVSIDRVNGSLIIAGTVSEVEAAVCAIIAYVGEKLGFSVCDITRT